MHRFWGYYPHRMGDRALSGKCFDAGVAAYVAEPFMQFVEWASDRRPDRPIALTSYITNAASFLLACTQGLCGLEIGPGQPHSWCAHGVRMPDLWEGVEIGRVLVRGRQAAIRGRHGQAQAPPAYAYLDGLDSADRGMISSGFKRGTAGRGEAGRQVLGARRVAIS